MTTLEEKMEENIQRLDQAIKNLLEQNKQDSKILQLLNGIVHNQNKVIANLTTENVKLTNDALQREARVLRNAKMDDLQDYIVATNPLFKKD